MRWFLPLGDTNRLSLSIEPGTPQGPNIEYWVEQSKEHPVSEVVRGSMSYRSFRRAHGEAMRMGKESMGSPSCFALGPGVS